MSSLGYRTAGSVFAGLSGRSADCVGPPPAGKYFHPTRWAVLPMHMDSTGLASLRIKVLGPTNVKTGANNYSSVPATFQAMQLRIERKLPWRNLLDARETQGRAPSDAQGDDAPASCHVRRYPAMAKAKASAEPALEREERSRESTPYISQWPDAPKSHCELKAR